MRPAIIALIALLLAPAAAQAKPARGLVRVEIVTSAGNFTVAVDTRRAPKTAANFLAYVDDGRFDGTSFYRAARSRNAASVGFVQGGIDTNLRRALPSIPLETTTRTGLRHVDGTLSMARYERPDSATGNFSIMVGAHPGMDAHPPRDGYAAFGRVVAGMAVVRRILALPTGGGSGEMRGQMILKPVRLVKARRIDGKPQPTDRARPWLLFER